MDWSALPPLTMLRAFEAAARHGGYSAAGRELNVTHAAVAQQVRGLEARLGVALMRREGRGVTPTAEGRALAVGLNAGLEAMREALDVLAQDVAARPVAVTLTPGFAASWLTPRLTRLRARHPELELRLNPTSDVVDMLKGEHDLAIRYGAGDWPGLASEPLLEAPIAVLAAPSLLRGRAIREPGDLLALPWLQESGSREWRSWMAAHGVRGIRRTGVTELPGYMLLEALRQGVGVGMVARAFVEDDIAAGRLVALFDEGGAAGYHIVRRPGPLRRDAALLIDWLRDEAAGAG